MQKILIILLLSISFMSCEKVIEIELDESKEQIVIEANLRAGDNPFTVLVSKTAPYFSNQQSVKVENADVMLFDDEGNSYIVPHTSNGLYSLPFFAEKERTYSLEVVVEDLTYSASSYLPNLIEIQEVYGEFNEAFGPNEAGYTVYFRYDDPAEVANFYRVRHSINGVLQNGGDDLQIVNDDLNDGSTARLPLFRQVFAAKDSITVELLHIDEASHSYFNSLGDIVGGGSGLAGGSTALGNPDGNWDNKALGYFMAVAVDTVSIVLPE